MTLPLHCLKPMPDWGIDLMKRKPLPTHAELADAFSARESFNRSETGYFIIRLVNELCRRLLLEIKINPNKEDYKDISRVLNLTMERYSQDADKCLPWELRKKVNSASRNVIADNFNKVYQLSMASANTLLKIDSKQGNNPLLIDIANLLAVVEYDIVTGAKIGREIEKRKKGTKATYQPDKYMVCYKALMIELAERMGVKGIKASTEMMNGVGALVNDYLAYRRDEETY